MSDYDTIINLKQSRLFEIADDSVLEKVSDVVQRISIMPGTELIKKGDSGDSMYIVCHGKVKVHDGDLFICHLNDGDVFGEMAALDGDVRTASITAVEKTSLIKLDRDDLFELGSKEPELAKSLIHFLCQRGKHIIHDITDRSFKLRELEKEFEIGRNIQAGFLPEEIPEIDGCEIGAYFRAAREVAGDFYDVFEIKGLNRLAFITGDVCGKGIGAALFMTLFRSLLRTSLLAGDYMNWTDVEQIPDIRKAPAKVLQNALLLTNNYVSQTHEKACMFATIFAGLLDTETGELLYINAGHCAPSVIKADGTQEFLPASGIAIGLFPHAEFTVERTVLNKSDLLLAYTDGVTEAVNLKNEEFSSEKLFRYFRENNGISSLDETLKNFVAVLDDFTGGQEQFDDITLLALRRVF